MMEKWNNGMMFRCSDVPVFQHSNLAIFQCSIFPIFRSLFSPFAPVKLNFSPLDPHSLDVLPFSSASGLALTLRIIMII